MFTRGSRMYLLVLHDAVLFCPGYDFRVVHVLPVGVELLGCQIAVSADVG